MAKINLPRSPIYTHEGAKASRINSEMQLRRSVMACLLWESQFYEDGVSIAERISQLVKQVKPETVAKMAVEAREQMKLRHVPLLLVREMARLDTHKHLVSSTLSRVIQRPDELAEYCAIYWKEGRQPLSAQSKKGLSSAFHKFSEYQLAKYNRKAEVKLKDVMFLSHPKPSDKDQEALWSRLINDQMETPDTWEVALSSGADKKETWERLLSERKLGGLALLRNLRNMKAANVNEELVFKALDSMSIERILPFRFISAAKYAPTWEPQIEKVMLRCLEGREKLGGKTILVVDASGSMFGTPVSKRSEIDRFEAAAALAIMARELCEKSAVIVFSNEAHLIPPRRGFALRDALYQKADRGGTFTQRALDLAANEGYDRVIVFTDEQSHQYVYPPKGIGYVVNVGSYQNGIGYGTWNHIDGFSEAILDYILALEKL